MAFGKLIAHHSLHMQTLARMEVSIIYKTVTYVFLCSDSVSECTAANDNSAACICLAVIECSTYHIVVYKVILPVMGHVGIYFE